MFTEEDILQQVFFCSRYCTYLPPRYSSYIASCTSSSTLLQLYSWQHIFLHPTQFNRQYTFFHPGSTSSSTLLQIYRKQYIFHPTPVILLAVHLPPSYSSYTAGSTSSSTLLQLNSWRYNLPLPYCSYTAGNSPSSFLQQLLQYTVYSWQCIFFQSTPAIQQVHLPLPYSSYIAGGTSSSILLKYNSRECTFLHATLNIQQQYTSSTLLF
jgi:hypothetical protein